MGGNHGAWLADLQRQADPGGPAHRPGEPHDAPNPGPGCAFLLATTACQPAPGPEAEASVAVAAPGGLELANLRRVVEIAHDKLVALAEAQPEGNMEWRPMDGVRSVSEVFVHVAADNWFVPAIMGIPAPEETGVTDDVTTFREYQTRTMSKPEMVAALDASFEHLLGAMDATSDELDRAMTLGQSETTVGDVWIRAVIHIHEHVGQSIAYARVNEIVPPWSR